MRKTLWSHGYAVLLRLLVEVREEAGLNQAQLAQRLKKPRSYVSKVEKGERRVDPEEVARWATACDLDPKQFFIRFARERVRGP